MRKRLKESKMMVSVGQVLCIMLWLAVTAGALVVAYKVHQGAIVGDKACGVLIATIVIAMIGWQVAHDGFERLDSILERLF